MRKLDQYLIEGIIVYANSEDDAYDIYLSTL